LTKVGRAKMHNAMFHDYRACQIFRVRYDCLQHEQQIMTVGVKQNEFLTLERATCLELFAIKLTVRTLAAAENSEEDRQRDTPVAEFCK